MPKCEKLVEVGRRQFLRSGAILAAASAAAAVPDGRAEASPSLALVNYAAKHLANVKNLKTDQPVQITYPDEGSPGVLLKLGRPVEQGVGPDHDIVAFSTLCPHKGFSLNYIAADKTLDCPGHYSRFDCENGGQEIWGHATQNLPQFTLRVDGNGDIHAVAVDELIYGRLSNVLTA